MFTEASVIQNQANVILKFHWKMQTKVYLFIFCVLQGLHIKISYVSQLWYLDFDENCFVGFDFLPGRCKGVSEFQHVSIKLMVLQYYCTCFHIIDEAPGLTAKYDFFPLKKFYISNTCVSMHYCGIQISFTSCFTCFKYLLFHVT